MNNILIVEDSKLSQNLIKDYLKEIDLEIISIVDNGKRALEVIETKDIHLAILDTALKGKMDGIELGKKISNLDIPVIYITEYNKERNFDSGGIYLKKPFTKEDLKNNIELIKYKKKLDNKLKNQNKLIENIDDQIWYIEKNNRYGIINKKHADFFNLNKKNIYGQKISEVLPESFLKVFLKLVLKAKKNNKKTKGIIEINKKILEVKVAPVKNNNGKEFICLAKDITSYQKNKDDLIRNTEFLENVFNSIQAGIIVLDNKLNIIKANPWIKKFYQEEGSIVGKKCFKIFQHQNKPCEKCPVIETLKTESPSSGKIVTKNNKTLEIFSYPLKDKFGNIKGVIEYTNDITQKVNTEKQLKDLNNIIKTSPAVVFKWKNDFNWTVEYVSENVKQFGYSKKDFLEGKIKYKDIVYNNDLENIIKQVKYNSKNNIDQFKQKYRIITADNKIKWINDWTIVVRDDNGKIINYHGIIIDVNEQVENQKIYRKHEKRWKFALESSQYGIWDWDLINNKVYFSKIWKNMLGYTLDEISNNLDEWEKRVHPDDIYQAKMKIQKHIDGKSEYYEDEHRMKHKDGHYIWIKDRGKIVEFNQNNTPIRFIGTHEDITKSKKVENKLKETTQKYKFLFKQAPYGVALIDLETLKAIDFNENMHKQLGYSREEFSNLTIFDYEYKESLKTTKKHIKKIIDNGKDEFRTIHKTKTDQLKDVIVIASIINLKEKEFMYINVRDVTEIIKMQEKLKRREERLNFAMNAAEHAFWDWDLDNDNVYFSPRYFTMLGYSKNELEMSFNTWKKLLHPKNKDKIINKIKNKIMDGIPFEEEFRLKTKDGNFKWIVGRGKAFELDKEGKPHRAVGTHTDITKRKKIEKKLIKSEKRYRSLIESQNDLIIRVDKDNKFTYVNDAYCKTFGTNRDDIIGKSFVPVVHKDHIDKTLKVIKNLIKSPYKAYLENKARTINGWRWFAWEGYAIKDQNDNVIEIQAVGRDITDLKNAKLKAESANKAKSEFLANMSHEIRTPLNALIGFSDLLGDYINNKQGEEYLKGIKNAGKNLLDLINDILDLSKIEAGKLVLNYQMTDIKKMLKELYLIFKPQTNKKDIKLIMELNNLPSRIYIDKIRVRQILLNLIGNAVKFTEKGFVKIDLEIKYKNDLISKLKINIIDTGIGISDNQKNNIFNSFEQSDGQSNRKYGGTGLGLAISKRLAKMMKGNIILKSELHKGSTFSLELYNLKFKNLKSSRKENLVKKDVYFKHSKLLIVDDSKVNIQVIKGWLKKYSNLEIKYVNSGKRAIDYIKTNSVDLIIMDILMPEMDGFETKDRISKINSQLPIIAFTASAHSRIKEKLDKNFIDYIFKPIKKDVFINKLKKYLAFKTSDRFSNDISDFSEKAVIDLKTNYKYEYYNIKELMINSDIEKFAKDIINFSNKKNYKKLNEYGKRLYKYANNFEINKMEETFEKLDEIFGGNKNE